MTTERQTTARQITLDAGVLATCQTCGALHRAGADPTAAYQLANAGFSRGLYPHFPDRRALTDAVKAAIDAAPSACACATKAPQPAPKPTAPTPLSPPQNRPAAATLRDIALGAVPSDQREHLLAWASENGIHTANDAFWPLAAAMANAMRAAASAGQHAQALAEETAKIPDLLYQNVTRAGADLKGAVSQAIEAKTVEAGQTLVQVIGAAAHKGALDLQQAAAGLERMGTERGAEFVEQWKASLARAIERQARSALAWKLASGWGTVAAIMILMMALGAGLGLGGALVEHKLITSRYLQFRRAATGGRPVVRFSGAQPIYKAQNCPAQDTCLAVPN